jgi:hypothetical protein
MRGPLSRQDLKTIREKPRHGDKSGGVFPPLSCVPPEGRLSLAVRDAGELIALRTLVMMMLSIAAQDEEKK